MKYLLEESRRKAATKYGDEIIEGVAKIGEKVGKKVKSLKNTVAKKASGLKKKLFGGKKKSPKKKGKSKSSKLTKCRVKINVSDQKMYQLGQHYNKHGKSMGYGSKKAYDAGAREFIEKKSGTAEIYEGIWNNSRGKQGGDV